MNIELLTQSATQPPVRTQPSSILATGSRNGLPVLLSGIVWLLCSVYVVPCSMAQDPSLEQMETARRKLEVEYRGYREMENPPPGFKPSQVAQCIDKLCDIDRKLIRALAANKEANRKRLWYLGTQLVALEDDFASFLQKKPDERRQRALKSFLEENFGPKDFLVTEVRLNMEDQARFAATSKKQRQKIEEIENDCKRAFEDAKNGKADEAVKTAQRAAALAREIFGTANRNTAETLAILANAIQYTTRMEAEGPLLEEVVEINKRVYGANHPETSQSLGMLAGYYLRMGDMERAKKTFEESCAIHEVGLHKDHPDYWIYLLEKSARLINPNYGPIDIDQAQALVQEAKQLVDIWDSIRSFKVPAKELEHIDNCSANIAFLQKDFEKAIQIWTAVLKRREVEKERNSKAKDDLESQIRLGLASAYVCKGDYQRAKEQYDMNRELTERNLGREHLGYAEAIGEMALGEWKLRRVEDSLIHMDEAMRIMRLQAFDILPYLPEPQQLQFLETQFSYILQGSLTLGCQLPKHAHAKELSASWLLNSKGLTNETLIDRYQMTRQTVSADSKALLSRWRQVRQRLAQESQNSQDNPEERSQLEMLERDLWTELAPQLGNYSKSKWVELEDVRKHLQKGEVLIEFARFQAYDIDNFHGQDEWMNSRYAAWIIPPLGESQVQLIELGESEVIDTAILEWRQQISQGGGGVEKNASTDLPAYRLRHLVLEPLEPHLNNASQLYIAPDGDLWLMPWCALPLKEERYLIEKYAMSLLVSGRDLATNRQVFDCGPSLVFANPDYAFDLSSTPRLAANQTLDDRNILSKSRAGTALNWGQLPGTELEAKELKPLLEKVTHKQVQALFGADARESQFNASSSPEILVFCTHGFFLPNQKKGKGQDAANTDPLENPLLRCGLVLAGANNRLNSGNNTTGGEDGLLTGLEVASSDLRGTKLVVLSACETAVGEVRAGEGVAGMRQAFQLAGAECVMGTLWQIPDQASALLMQKFWTGVAASKSKAQSLRMAQIEMIRDFDSGRDNVRGFVRESNSKTRSVTKSARLSPYYWAAYSLTGDVKGTPAVP